jgi:hypothetical protein
MQHLMQPLVSRPAYGRDAGSGLPGAGPGGAPLPVENGIPNDEKQPTGKSPVGEAKLPGDGQGGSDKGLSLEKDIPGTSTFNKPEGDIRDFDKGNNTDPWRRDSPDDQLKDRERVDTKEDWSEPQDGIGEMGKGKSDPADYNKTKWPYRDDSSGHPQYASSPSPVSRRFNANAELVAQLFLLRFAHEAIVEPQFYFSRTAATIDDVTNRLEPAIEDRARSCTVSVRRVDAGNLRWLFSVDCGNGPKVVRLKGSRIGNIVRLAKMQLKMSCSCPAWRWQGPEYHAKQEQYQDGRPQGTASTPNIRDPHRVHQACKHVAAVLNHIRKWEVPLAKDEGGEGEK